MLTRCIPYRPHDYIYDPLFTVSGPVDHYKAAIVAKMSAVKFQICPVFDNIFSELPNHPRLQYVERRQRRPIQSYKDYRQASKKHNKKTKFVEVGGKDRSKFFSHIIDFPPKDFQKNPIRFTFKEIPKCYTGEDAHNNRLCCVKDGSTAVSRSVKVQTMYRESEAQTIPWEPPYEIIGEGEPEILLLEYLTWGKGLPAGMHELKLIERARMKRAWVNTIKPNAGDENSLEKYRDYIEALERDEWAFREMEIQDIQDIRLHLLEKMLEDIHEISHKRAKTRLDKFVEKKEKEKQEKLKKIRGKAAREIRKLEFQRRGQISRYHEPDIIDEHVSKISELYAPLIRHGEHPKRSHFVVDEKMKEYKEQFIGVENFNTLPQWLNKALTIKPAVKKTNEPQLCIRETKWTAKTLEQLHEELKNVRKEVTRKITIRRLKSIEEVEEEVMQTTERIPPEQEQDYQNIVFLQSLLKGRAVQMLVYEGRENCKELIRELRNSIGLLKKEKEARAIERSTVRLQQREEAIESVMISRLQGTLGRLQGKGVGLLLDFLNKELQRLLEERKAHAMCWINERERNIREAAEAGRRQKEIRRRKEHDEIFKQIVKITQDSVDVYLRDIITEGMEFSSADEAEKYIKSVAKRLDNQVEDVDKTFAMAVDEEDELISDLLHHHLLPQVKKESVRNRLKAKQKQQANVIFEAVHSKFENVFKQEFDANDSTTDFASITGTDKFSLSDRGTSWEYRDILNQVDPDLLEKYLNTIAQEDLQTSAEKLQQPFPIMEKFPMPDNYKHFVSYLETIPEIEHETSTEITSNSANTTEIFNTDLKED